ncbi:phage tail protein [Deinococcus maricopensis]|uniref:Phage tail protein n=1 Tax=Deinococcus maricopensis (strain DSM 21211 / LMG 22137 / NRRL B-23946 / LB-34) TaxID=709986 RepID=E8U3P2_DEIML|nr:phage tail protein [Deinococcus maricopensis]ADV68666.1 phage tail protein [Deinococcus maricopensis DSM 21211]
MPRLHVRQRGETLRVLPLDMRQLSIGRTPDNGLPLRDASVAVRHAEINWAPDRSLTLTDLGGGDTFVNGRRLAPNQPHRLLDGDEIQVGPFTVTFVASDTDAPAATPAPATPDDLLEGLAATPAPPPRPTFPAPPPPAQNAMYLNFLPGLFQESPFLNRYLKIFEAIWEPLQHRQDHLELYLDARTTPPRFLPWLADWLGLPLNTRWPEARQRAWVREAMALYRWRGTRYGLTRALEVAFGLTPALIEDPNRPHTLRVLVLDPGEDDEHVTREGVRELVYRHAPAHVLCSVEFIDPARVQRAPTPDAPTPPAPGTLNASPPTVRAEGASATPDSTPDEGAPTPGTPQGPTA